METLTLPDAASTSTGPKLTLLSTLQPGEDWRRYRAAAAWSVGAHVVVTAVLLLFRIPPPPQFPPDETFVKHVTPLYLPPELTQKAPNKVPPKKELVLESIAARPTQKTPAPAPAPVAKAAPAKQLQLPPTPAPVAQNTPKPLPVDAPKIEAPPAQQASQVLNTQPLPPPPGNGPPKIALEDVTPKPAGGGRPAGGVVMPSNAVQDALRSLNRSGGPGASAIGETVTDEGSGPGLNLPASAGRPQSSLQLRSDPMGVDFKPYMIQVLAAVRRNWFAVYPEAAKTGARGQVVLQFRVDKKGGVVKVVFDGTSPSRPLNEAAVAAISASNPMPPLPAAFKGDSIVLQMTFLYNMPK